MSDKVLVTGAGIISSLGFNTEETASALGASRSGIGKITLLDTIHKDSIPAAEVKATDNELKELSEISGKGSFSRTALLGIIAARQAMLQADINRYK